MALGIPLRRTAYQPEPQELTRIRMSTTPGSGLKNYGMGTASQWDWVTTAGKSFTKSDLCIYHLVDRNIEYAVTSFRLYTYGDEVGTVTWPVTWTITFHGQTYTSSQTRDGQSVFEYFSFPLDDPLIVKYDDDPYPGDKIVFSCASTIPVTPNQGQTGHLYGWGSSLTEVYGWQI